MFRFRPIAGAIIMVLASILFTSLSINEAKADLTCPNITGGQNLYVLGNGGTVPTCGTTYAGSYLTIQLTTAYSLSLTYISYWDGSSYSPGTLSCSGGNCNGGGIAGGNSYQYCGGSKGCEYTFAFTDPVTSEPASAIMTVADNGTDSGQMTGITITGGRFSDSTPPSISQVTAVPSPTTTTPNYTFSSNESGTINFGGDCSSVTTHAISGNNPVTFNTLSNGTHSNCTISVTDVAGNVSNILPVNSFDVDAVKPNVAITTNTSGAFNESTLTPFTATVTFNESVINFVSGELTATNATVDALTGSGTTYAAIIRPNGEGSVALNVAAGVAQDSANNTNTVAPQVTVTQTDDVAPVISEASPTASPSPYIANYQLNSNEAGTFTYGGDCSSSNTTANVGLNSLNFNALSHGTHSNCTITVTDAAGNISDTLNVTSFDVDSVKPTAAITTDSGGSFNESTLTPFTATITFTEGVRSFLSTELVATNADVSTFTSGAYGDSVYTVTITPNGDGNVTLNVSDNVAFDYVNNYSNGAPQVTVTQIDDVVPSVAITTNSGGAFNLSTLTPFTATVTFSETVTGFTNGELTASNATVGTLSGSGTTYTTTITPNGQGNIALNVAASVAQDGANNNNTIASQVTVTQTDDVVPSVVSFTRQLPTTQNTNADTLVFRATFSEAVQAVDSADFVANGTTASVSSASTISSTVYDITLSGGNLAGLDGLVGLDLNNSQNIQDLAGNNLSTSEPTTDETYREINGLSKFTGAPAILHTDGACTAASQTMAKLFLDISVPPNQTLYPILLDKNDKIISSWAVSNAGQSTPRYSGNTNTLAQFNQDNMIAPFRVVLETNSGTFPNIGSTYTGTPSDSQAVDAYALDPDCPDVDTTAPTPTFFVPFGVTVNESTLSAFPATVTFNEPVTGFVGGELTATNATVGTLNGSGTTYWATITPNGDGHVALNVAANVAKDLSGNDNVAATQLTFTLQDDVAPRVAISTGTVTSFLESTLTPFTATITFSEIVTNFADGELTATNATIGTITGSGTTYTATITPNGNGDIALNLAANVAYDGSSNGNVVASQVTVAQTDDVAPTVAIITDSGGSFNESTLSSFIATITFNEAVTDFVDGELTATNATATNFSGSGTTFTATITPDGKGAIALNVSANVAQDTSNNNNTAAPQITVMQTDDVAPTAILSGVPAIAGPNRGFTITLTFSEAVTGLLPSDIGATNAIVNNLSPVSGNGTTFTATVTPDGFGDVTVSLPQGMAQDGASNGNVAVAAQTATLDNTKPTVAILNTPPSHDGASAFNVTFTFSEQLDKGSFEESDIVLTNATASNFSTNDGITFTADITPLSTLDVTINVAANVAEDLVGNGNTAATQVSITGDRISPNVSILNAPEKHDRVTPFNVTVEFNEDVFGFVASGISTTNATVSNFTVVNGNTFTADITPTGPRDITLDIAVGAAKDFAGNDNNAAAQVIINGTAIEDTKRVISSFMSNRANHILSNQPNLIGFASGQINSGGGPLGNVQINGNEGGVEFSFSTSRSKILSSLNNNSQAYKADRIGAAFGIPANQQTLGGQPIGGEALGFAPVANDTIEKPNNANAVNEIDALDQGIDGANETNSRAGKFDVWTQIYGSQSNTGDVESSLWVGYLGAHYFTNENTLIGVVGQLDWTRESNSTDASKASGRGWMIGPYIAGQVPDQNLFYEARASWGKSNNEVSPYGTYTDSFETTRWLTSAKISGSYKLDNVTLSPTASVSYYTESQESFTDSLSNVIDEQTISLGELRFGPVFSKTIILENGSTFIPKIGVSGVWNFGIENTNTSQANLLNNDDLRARIDAGMSFKNAVTGTALQLEGFYDGVGIDDFDAFGGSVKIVVPLH